MFEKFHYADPPEIEQLYKDIWDFATEIVLDEYSYMSQSMILSPLQTEKNMDSTPAFPKFLLYDTERDYIEEHGWTEYMELWNADKRKRVLWWTFLKNETLKKQKVEQDDIRMIMCTDPVFTRFGAAFDQHQNQMMKERTETHQAQVGWTPFYDGFNQRLRRLETRGDQIIEMDWTRFDGTIPAEVFSHIKNIRWFLHAEDYKTSENKERYDWYVFNLINKVVLLPSGEVTVIRKGNPSGQISTTTDNNFVNTFLTAFEIGFLHKEQHGVLPTLQEYRLNVDSICYGDDRLLSVNKNFLDYDPLKIPDFYKNVFGMWVKPENIKKFPTCEGTSFCGLTAVKSQSGYVGVPNVDKILSTIEHPTKRLPNIEALWGKLISLRILTEFAPKEVNDYLAIQIAKVREVAESENIELPEVPKTFYRNIWTGGPKINGNPETSASAQTAQAKDGSRHQN
nr:MAG: RNA-dependent RNA polymerase [Astroviridae sp.]